MNKDDLFKRQAVDFTDTVVLGENATVLVRALSRAEVDLVRKAPEKDYDALVCVYGMTDPELTITEVREWFQMARAGDVVKVTEAIREASGLGEGAGKSGHNAAE
jgi:hypothetical protein